MPRSARNTPGGLVYHVYNHAVARLPIFEGDADYETFEFTLAQAVVEHPIRVLGYCLMPTHWHMVLWPRKDGELSAFLRWMSHTHTMRWHAQHRSFGSGHLYQGRFKSFPIETGEPLLTVLRYVESNPVRAHLVDRAQDWLWSSLVMRRGNAEAQAWLTDAALPEPAVWLRLVNKPLSEAELTALRLSLARGAPFGSPAWVQRIVRRLGMESTIRPRGRPRKLPLKDAPSS